MRSDGHEISDWEDEQENWNRLQCSVDFRAAYDTDDAPARALVAEGYWELLPPSTGQSELQSLLPPPTEHSPSSAIHHFEAPLLMPPPPLFADPSSVTVQMSEDCAYRAPSP